MSSGQHIKIVVVGDGAVGKTSLLWVFANNSFPEDYIPTVFDNYTANVLVDDSMINLGLWDTAGQEDYDRLRPLSYHETQIFLVCFSCDDKMTLDNVKSKWVPEIRMHVQNALIMLVGTKCDLRERNPDSPKNTTPEMGMAMKRQVGAAHFIECSAKTQHNVKEVFEQAIRVYQNPKLYGEKKKDKKGCTIL